MVRRGRGRSAANTRGRGKEEGRHLENPIGPIGPRAASPVYATRRRGRRAHGAPPPTHPGPVGRLRVEGGAARTVWGGKGREREGEGEGVAAGAAPRQPRSGHGTVAGERCWARACGGCAAGCGITPDAAVPCWGRGRGRRVRGAEEAAGPARALSCVPCRCGGGGGGGGLDPLRKPLQIAGAAGTSAPGTRCRRGTFRTSTAAEAEAGAVRVHADACARC